MLQLEQTHTFSSTAEEVGHDHVQYIFAELAHILDYDFNVKF